VYGYYVHPTPDANGDPVVVRLLANPEDKERFEAEGFVYLGEAPPPGTSTPEEEEKALAQAQREAARKAEPKADEEKPDKPDEPQRAIPRGARA
jgi:hypothetical protein